MSVERALGGVIRDARLNAGLNLDAFADVTSRSHMRDIERGLVSIRVDTLAAIASRLGIAASELLLVAESRADQRELKSHARAQAKNLERLIETGRFTKVSPEIVAKGLRGKKADETRVEVLRLQASGYSRQAIANQLGKSLRTVGRYLIKPEGSPTATNN